MKKILVTFLLLSFYYVFVFGQEQEELIVTIPDYCSCEQLIAPGDIPNVINYKIRAFGNGDPVLFMLNSIVFIDDKDQSIIQLPYENKILDIHWDGIECFYSSNNTIYYGDENGNTFPMVAASAMIDSFQLSSECFYFAVNSSIIKFDFTTQATECVYKFKDPITGFEPFDDAIFVSTTKELFVLHGNTIKRLFQVDSRINTFALAPKGNLCVGTDKDVMCFDPDYNNATIINKAAKDMTIINNSLYVILENNSCLRINGIDKLLDNN